MKKLKLIALGVFLFVSSLTQAQVSVSVNVGVPPVWGPVGYSNVQFYYLPDVQAYYDIRATQFIYIKNGKWFRSRYLPGNYRNYDLYNGYKVVLNDYHGSHPYYNFNSHKAKYYKGYKGSPQKTIGKNPHHYENKGNGHYDNSHNGKGYKEEKHHNEGKENKGKGNGKH